MAKLIAWEDIRPGMELHREGYMGPYPEDMNPLIWQTPAVKVAKITDDEMLYVWDEITDIYACKHRRNPAVRWWQGMPTDDERRAAKWPKEVSGDG